MTPPRYPDVQDPKEPGLELFRAQYGAVFDNPEQALFCLGWDDRNIVAVSGVGLGRVICRAENAAAATLICRALTLGWKMLNELEPRGRAN